MTYNVSMGTLNPTIPYHTLLTSLHVLQLYVVSEMTYYVSSGTLNSTNSTHYNYMAFIKMNN